VAALIVAVLPASPMSVPAEPAGLALALVSGAVTSGLGYALWYTILPGLGAARGGVAQLSVPVLALAGGMVLLGEPLTLRFFLASVLVLGGVSIAVRPARQP
jgi:drug/metabolite transporter (DMT)-like permease